MGRRPIRFEMEAKILKAMESAEFPVTCSYIKKEISKRRNAHFDTVKKYLEDLVQKGAIFKKVLPPTKKHHKKGMTLYSKKPFPHQW